MSVVYHLRLRDRRETLPAGIEGNDTCWMLLCLRSFFGPRASTRPGTKSMERASRYFVEASDLAVVSFHGE